MALVEWTQKLSVGIPSIDKQHQKLIELLNAFFVSVQNKDGKGKIATVIKGLKDYTIEHFNSEEAVMRIHKYPGLEVQVREHESFVKTVQDFEDRFNKGKLILTLEITNFIRDWITNHIMNVDKQYSDFLAQRGVK